MLGPDKQGHNSHLFPTSPRLPPATPDLCVLLVPLGIFVPEFPDARPTGQASM